MADMTAGMHKFWPQVLEAVKNRRRFAWILLAQNTEVLFYDGTTLTLSATNQGVCDNLAGSGSSAVLDEALAEVLNTRPTVELVVEGQAPFALPSSTPRSPATEVRVSVAVTTSETSSQTTEASTPTLHLVLAQTAFLMHEQGNNQAAALLADVEDVELVPGNRFGDWQDAVLIVPPYLVPRFTENVTAVIQPVFEHVAGRHGLEIGGVTAAPALPDIGDDWRQILQARLAGGAASNQASRTRAKGVAPRSAGRLRLRLARGSTRLRGAEEGAGGAAPGFHHRHLSAADGTCRRRQRVDTGLPCHRFRQGGDRRSRRPSSPKAIRRGRHPRPALAQQRNCPH